MFSAIAGGDRTNLETEGIRMTHTADLAALHAHLDARPDDWTARRQLADLLTDLGRDQEAACQRWMVKHRRCPRTRWLDLHYLHGWHWWRSYVSILAPRWAVWRSGSNDTLPDEVALHMPRWAGDNRQQLESALLAALVAAGEI